MSDDRANQDEMSGPENDLRQQNPGQTTAGDFANNDDAADGDSQDADLDGSDLDDDSIEEPGTDDEIGRIGEDADLDVKNE